MLAFYLFFGGNFCTLLNLPFSPSSNSKALSNSENIQSRGKNNNNVCCWLSEANKNWKLLFFCSFWFEINFYCSSEAGEEGTKPEGWGAKSSYEGCQMNRISFSLTPSAPMILNVNEGMKFLFLFYFHIVFLFPALFFSLPPLFWNLVVCFRPYFSPLHLGMFCWRGRERWLFCALVEKIWLLVRFCYLIMRIAVRGKSKKEGKPPIFSPHSSTARHRIKFFLEWFSGCNIPKQEGSTFIIINGSRFQ